ncbi:hypothetical protein ACFYKX_02755 [Cytobacillus sp. FJAT-54145]|uniref:Uncharacterized protein n=1 Tax=Cytobacillus spartinae TaxID=3299023 RepID=A0ABW6K5S6_9BACI
MNMYEKILTIIEKNGPVSFSSICNEINDSQGYENNQEKPIKIAQVKSAVSRKKDLFSVDDNIVSIRQEKELVSLTASIGGFPGPTHLIRVDFINEVFYFFEWCIDCKVSEKQKRLVTMGSVEQFKKEIYKMKIWDWKRNYQLDHLVLDGTSWNVKLKTKSKVYESEGLESFPSEWTKFSRAINKLTGIYFH